MFPIRFGTAIVRNKILKVRIYPKHLLHIKTGQKKTKIGFLNPRIISLLYFPYLGTIKGGAIGLG